MKKRILFIILTTSLFFTSVSAQFSGTIIDVRGLSDGITYRDSQNTIKYSDSYFYHRFSISIPMTVTISHCGSDVKSTSLSLYNSNGELIESKNNAGIVECYNNNLAYIKRRNLQPGIYYIKSEFYNEIGNIKLSIRGRTPYLDFSTMDDAINIGIRSTDFSYLDSQNTIYYVGESLYPYFKELFYKFTIDAPMDITISNCGSELEDTYMHLLDASGDVIVSNDNYSGPGACNNPKHAWLKMNNLAPGTYYISSQCIEEYGGFITTSIEGVSLASPAPVGDTMSNPIDIGIKSSDFVYSDNQNTNMFINQHYYGKMTKDVFYKFSIETPMDIIISHCGSELSDTYINLLNVYGTLIAFNDDYSGDEACGNPKQAYLKIENLPVGTYYVVSEGYSENGNITTRIEGVVPPPNPPGNKMSTALNLGSKSNAFLYADTQDTNGFTDEYHGQTTNDVFYTFTLTTKLDVTISHCGSAISDTHVYLLNHSGSILYYNNNHSESEVCNNTHQAYLKINDLAPGTYYVVSEGVSSNGILTTTIEGKPNPPGNKMHIALDLGSKSSGFIYSNTQNTINFTNDYQGQSTNDVFYKLTLSQAMDIYISHCESEVYDTYVHLLNSSGIRIAYNDNYYGEGACGNTAHAYLKIENLEPGTYYVVSEGNSTNGNITTRIEGILPPPNPPGNKMSTALNIGSKSNPFIYTNTQDTNGFTDEYWGQATNDVFYIFTLTTPLDITISHCGSGVTDTYLHLLDVNGNRIAYNDDSSALGSCSNPLQAYLKMESLSAGTYYIVSEGKTTNGNITTRIEGSIPPPNPPGNNMNNALNIGIKSSSFIYSDTQDTNGFTNDYNGQPTADVFYKFTLTTPMHITLSHCGSGLYDTYIHLLDETGNRIAYNDNYYAAGVCTNASHAYLRKENLSAGTYYVVSEGKTENGSIFTYIEGEKYTAPSLSSSQNYILTITPTAAVSSIDAITEDKALRTIQYFDGLGRPLQTVQVKASPAKADLVTFQEYDAYGRESKAWLPVTVENNNGAFVPYGTFTAKSLASYSNDPKAYSEPVYENSPLNRIVEQFGPGQDWQNNGKAVRTAYLTNNSTYPCKLYTTSNDGQVVNIERASESPDYAGGQLFVTRMTDEDGNISYEFKDKLGQVVLTRQMEGTEAHDTYYVYDHFGNLRAVLPPLAADNLNIGSWPESNTYLQQYAYLYKYDYRNRCIAKKLPGAEWIYYMYDKADRLIFTQDGNQREDSEWTFSIPDAHGRVVLSGTCNNTLNYPDELNNGVVVANWENTETPYKGYAVDAGALQLTGVKLLTVNYYDSYEFMGKNGIHAEDSELFKFRPHSGFQTRYTHSAKGLHTGKLTALTDEENTVDKHLAAVMYYDYRGRLIQNHAENHINGAVNKYSTHYNFAGMPQFRHTLHNRPDKPTITEYGEYAYDHAGRLLTNKHRLTYHTGQSNWITLAQCEYDELGRLQTKKLHGDQANPIGYTYNIRGWLTGINGNHFTESLYYNTGNGAPMYNGNISSMAWRVAGESVTRGYTFDYDGLNRMTLARYGEGNRIADNLDLFTEKIKGYDKHGNITGIERYGRTGAWSYGLVDNLGFGYTGNRMKFVNDAVIADPAAQSFQFREHSNSTGDEYEYDANGNLIKDSNKNITDIRYNILNLPSRVEFSADRSATYLYDAEGVKRKATYRDGGVTKTTDYLSNVIYENNKFSRILTDEGYLTVEGVLPTYHYFIKDHLGNNRVVLNEDGVSVEQVNHYYPFGGLFEQSAEDVQRYKYNGKELDRNLGLDLYDYSARYMDGNLGRFTTMDPLAEKYYGVSPYHYAGNNPVRFVDPTGMSYTDYEIDVNGYIRRIGDIDDKPDRLYGTNQSTGERESITVNDKEILKTLSGESNIQERDAHKGNTVRVERKNGKLSKKTITPMVNGHVAETHINEDAGSIFVFASKTSNVEWAKANNKTGSFIVGTLHENAQGPSFQSLGEGYAVGNLTYYVHSHTGKDPKVDFNPSSPDIRFARRVINGYPRAKVELYAPWKPDNKFINLNKYAK